MGTGTEDEGSVPETLIFFGQRLQVQFCSEPLESAIRKLKEMDKWDPPGCHLAGRVPGISTEADYKRVYRKLYELEKMVRRASVRSRRINLDFVSDRQCALETDSFRFADDSQLDYLEPEVRSKASTAILLLEGMSIMAALDWQDARVSAALKRRPLAKCKAILFSELYEYLFDTELGLMEDRDADDPLRAVHDTLSRVFSVWQGLGELFPADTGAALRTEIDRQRERVAQKRKLVEEKTNAEAQERKKRETARLAQELAFKRKQLIIRDYWNQRVRTLYHRLVRQLEFLAEEDRERISVVLGGTAERLEIHLCAASPGPTRRNNRAYTISTSINALESGEVSGQLTLTPAGGHGKAQQFTDLEKLQAELIAKMSRYLARD